MADSALAPSSCAAHTDKAAVSVVLPTPPFELTTAIVIMWKPAFCYTISLTYSIKSQRIASRQCCYTFTTCMDLIGKAIFLMCYTLSPRLTEAAAYSNRIARKDV